MGEAGGVAGTMGKGEATRNRILDEAVRIASRDGLQGLTIGSLSQALSLSKSGLFLHFGSKEALQVAVLEHAFDRVAAFIRPRVEGARDPLDLLRKRFLATLDWIDNPELPGGCPITAAGFELDDREGAPREALVARQAALRDWTVKQFGAFAAPGADPEQLAFEYRAIALAYHHASRVLRDPGARDRVWKAFEALLARAETPSKA